MHDSVADAVRERQRDGEWRSDFKYECLDVGELVEQSVFGLDVVSKLHSVGDEDSERFGQWYHDGEQLEHGNVDAYGDANSDAHGVNVADSE